jgi:type I restriction-modification system DNA methylase subunit
MAKDLGEMTENLEDEVENLKNTKMKIFGITMTPTTIGAAFAVVTTVMGTLYGAFESYKAFQEMSEKLEVLDLEAVEARNAAIEAKLDDAIDYTRDIKNSLRDDISRIERVSERTSGRVKDIQDTIDDQLREVSDLTRETEKDVRDTMRGLEGRIEDKMDKLDEDLRETLQKALDNPLADI